MAAEKKEIEVSKERSFKVDLSNLLDQENKRPFFSAISRIFRRDFEYNFQIFTCIACNYFGEVRPEKGRNIDAF